MSPKPEKEHEWLRKLVGEWTYTIEAKMGPDQPPAKFSGAESARPIGGLWVVSEGSGETPGGGNMTSVLTLGYDPRKERFVGTWVGSVMSHLWVYDGGLDASRNVLTLDTEGPDHSAEGKLTKYRDVIEFEGNDHRVLTSAMLADDGNWRQFMTANYLRKK